MGRLGSMDDITEKREDDLPEEREDGLPKEPEPAQTSPARPSPGDRTPRASDLAAKTHNMRTHTGNSR